MITNIDDNMGKLFAKLDQLSITENNIVIFMVDKGPTLLMATLIFAETTKGPWHVNISW